MKHEPGVLCIVIGAETEDGRKKFVGRAVELVLPASPQWPTVFKDYLWKPDEGDCWIVGGNIVGGNLGYTMIKEKYLLPIFNRFDVPDFKLEDDGDSFV